MTFFADAARARRCASVLGMAKRRLDSLLAERGLFESRSQAAASVMAGEVLVGAAQRCAAKAGELIDVAEQLSVRERPADVSRGGIKLANALDSAALSVAVRRALDVGASTGGFTDCLLQRRARGGAAGGVGYRERGRGLRAGPRGRGVQRRTA